MRAHEASSASVSLAWLVEDAVRDPELADVVQQRGAAEVAHRSAAPNPARSPIADRRSRPPARSGERSRATWRRSPGRRPRRRGRGARRRRPATRSGGSRGRLVERRPAAPRPGSSEIAQKRVDEVGIEPVPAPSLGDRPRGAHAAVGVEELDGLGQADDAAEQRDLLAAQAVGLAVAVPVLVERADRLGRLPERSSMRAISAPRSQRACISERVTSPSARIARRRSVRRAPDACGPPRPHERRRAAAPSPRASRSAWPAVVGAEQRRHARRVGRAAGVLQQQRVEEVRARAGRRARSPRPRACRSGTSARRAPAAGPRSGRAHRRAPR